MDTWAQILDDLESSIEEVGIALADGRPVPQLTSLPGSPSDELRDVPRAQSLLAKIAACQERLQTELEEVAADLEDLARRRGAVRAYAGRPTN